MSTSPSALEEEALAAFLAFLLVWLSVATSAARSSGTAGQGVTMRESEGEGEKTRQG